MLHQRRPLDELLSAIASAEAEPLALLGTVLTALRPRNPRDVATPTRVLQELTRLLHQQPELRAALRSALFELLAQRRAVSFYADTGVFPSRGFFSESLRRISRSLLPDEPNPAYLKDAVSSLFDRTSDALWIAALPDHLWYDLLRALQLDEPGAAPQGASLLDDLCEALRVISYRIAAIGLEPELVRVLPALEDFESPFLAQNPEMLRYLAEYRAWWLGNGPAPQDDRHLRVLLAQTDEVAERVRARASREGTSLSLTLLLRRINQQLDRCNALLDVLAALAKERASDAAIPALVRLTKRLITEVCREDDPRTFWRANLDLLAHRVTENAGRTGEHYIITGRGEYFTMLRSAALAGMIIACMALSKLFIGDAHLAPLTEALAICLNYGVGFVFIHILHGTVATKQSAMTAATIAASLEQQSNRQRNLDGLATLVARTSRSQLVAILGNVTIAIPTAILLGSALAATGHPYPTPAQADYLLASVHPWLSGSLLFAAIAGVCLFLTGLISGYYDNLAAYNHIPQRLMALKGPRWLFGEARWQRICRYIENNLGALAGNFFFGFLLGGVSAFGVLFGLPVDIRHIAFSAAHLGYSLQTLGFALPWQELLIASLGVLLIGLINLTVSFALSLRVACRARGVSFSRGALLLRVIKLFLRQPREFFLPPRAPQTQPLEQEQRPK